MTEHVIITLGNIDYDVSYIHHRDSPVKLWNHNTPLPPENSERIEIVDITHRCRSVYGSFTDIMQVIENKVLEHLSDED